MGLTSEYHHLDQAFATTHLRPRVARCVLLLARVFATGIIMDPRGDRDTCIPSLVCEMSTPEAPMRDDILAALRYLVERTSMLKSNDQGLPWFAPVWVQDGLVQIVPRAGIDTTALALVIDLAQDLPQPDFGTLRKEAVRFSGIIEPEHRPLLAVALSHLPHFLKRRGFWERFFHGPGPEEWGD